MLQFLRILPYLLALTCSTVLAQTTYAPTQSFDSLSLEELMNVKITIASIKELTPRQSPGIVTTISSDDIRNMGARDLMDILSQVPGFEFGVDVEGTVGMGVRGNWAHEGKVVLFYDGREMNESLYSTLQFGNHYPVENIERIEIIRGPGSALHGGFATYAVINIITRAPKNKFETAAGTDVSFTATGQARRATSVYGGHAGGKGSFAVKFNASETQRSHNKYTDVYGSSYSMKDQSSLKNYFLNADGQIGGLQLRIISDLYELNSRDEYVEIGNQTSALQFTNQSVDLKYNWKKGERLKIIPAFQVNRQRPWSTPASKINNDPDPFRIKTTGYQASINTSYDLSHEINMAGGITWNRNEAINELEGEAFQTTGTNSFSNENLAVYAQFLYSASWANIIGGIRFNHNERYENSMVPRIGITKEFEKFHVKALYSRAFRAPATQNIDLSNNIQPEYTNVFEVEGGVKLSEDVYLTVNAFSIRTSDQIVYFFDTLYNSDAYTNFKSTGSAGLETVLQLRKKWGSINLNYSLYKSSNEAGDGLYSVPGHDGEHLGLAKQKANLVFSYFISPQWQAAITGTWLSERYGIESFDPVVQEAVYKRYPAFTLLNARIDYRFKKIKGLSAGIGVRNMLDQHERFIQPYNSNHAPLPGMSRELLVKIAYQNF